VLSSFNSGQAHLIAAQINLFNTAGETAKSLCLHRERVQ
jgi:hypothetical protein